MPKQKLFRYSAITELPNTLVRKNYKPGELSDLHGLWAADVFKNEQPIVLELACGAGDYAIALAKRYPHRNFIAMDIKGDRLYKGARYAVEHGLENVRFFRASIDHFSNYFGENEISEIWITFPDPYLSVTKQKKRLTHTKFLSFYKPALRQDGNIHLKTDSQELYAFTKEMIEESKMSIDTDLPDVYASAPFSDVSDITTYYERMHLKEGKKITYLKFSF